MGVQAAGRTGGELHRGHDDGGHDELVLQGGLDLVDGLGGLQVRGQQRGQQRHNDAGGGDQQRVRHGGPRVAGAQGRHRRHLHPPAACPALDRQDCIRRGAASEALTAQTGNNLPLPLQAFAQEPLRFGPPHPPFPQAV